MNKRPQPGEDDEALLKLQEQFLADKNSKSASKLIGTGIKRKAEEPAKRLSKFAEAQRKKKEGTVDAVIHDPKVLADTPLIIKDIVEKNLIDRDVVMQSDEPIVVTKQRGFPQVFKYDKTLDETKNSSKSIFAMQFEKQFGSQLGKRTNDATSSKATSIEDHRAMYFGKSSGILQGSGLESGQKDIQEIHKENVEKLSGLTEEEILKEQQSLIESIQDPKLIEFLKSRRKKNTATSTSKSVSFLETPQAPEHMEVCSEVPVEEEVANEDLPINPEEAKKWPNMGDLEKDKLQWMSKLPATKPVDYKTGCTARFDLEGYLLAAEDDAPVIKALHHHGDEPERAGYTIEELFHLCQSRVLQQRTLALHTLANIIQKAKNGLYDDAFRESDQEEVKVDSLIGKLLESGALLVFRHSLDDNNESMLSASCHALYCLVANEADEMCLDRMVGWPLGLEQPSLPSSIDKDPTKEKQFKEEEEEIKDFQLVSLDVVRALLRMDTLPRLRYILDILRPEPSVVIHCLGILIRMARHSLTTSTTISSHPYLMQTIFSNFLPQDWAPLLDNVVLSNLPTVYGYPLRYALKLVRVLASWGPHIASEMVIKHGVMKAILSYVTIEPSEAGVPLQEALKLSLESFHTWNVLMTYGLAVDSFLDYFPLITRHLQFFLGKINVNEKTYENRYNYEYGAAMIGVINTAFCLATQAEPRIQLENLQVFMKPLREVLLKWLIQLVISDRVSSAELTLVGSAADALGAVFEAFAKPLPWKCSNEPNIKYLDEIKEISDSVILPFLNHKSWSSLTEKLQKYSGLLSGFDRGTKRDPEQLPSFGSVTWGQPVIPLLQDESPFHFMFSLARLVKIFRGLHKGLATTTARKITDDPNVVKFVQKLIHQDLSLWDNWFERVEIHFLCHLCSLAEFSETRYPATYHSLAVKLMAVVQRGDEFLISDLMKISFNGKYLASGETLEDEVKRLELSDVTYISSASQKDTSISTTELIKRGLDRLPNIHDTFRMCLKTMGILFEKSENRYRKNTQKIDTLTVWVSGENVLPFDWPYLPILLLHNQTMGKETQKDVNMTDAEFINTVRDGLYWVLILMRKRRSAVLRMSYSSAFCRLACVFLAANDLFLDAQIHGILQALLRETLKGNACTQLDFRTPIPGITAFLEFYTALVEHFESVSYGDSLFAHMVLIPMAQKHEKAVRRLVWGERNTVLRLIRIKPEEMLIPMDVFLEPPEEDETMIQMYSGALFGGEITEARNPIPYAIAAHHVRQYIRGEGQHPLQRQIRQRLNKDPNGKLYKLLVGE